MTWVRPTLALFLGTLTMVGLLLWTFAQPSPTKPTTLPWVTAGARSWRFSSGSTWARDDLVALVSPSADGSPISADAFKSPDLAPIKHSPWRSALIRTGAARAHRGGTWTFTAFGFPFRAAARGEALSNTSSESWGNADIWWPTPTSTRTIAVHPIWPGLLANIALATLLWLLLLPIPGMLRRSSRRRHGLCPFCGYDLRGDLSRPCSECGRAPSIIKP